MMIYLDYASATPVEDEVLDTFYNMTKKYYANPNSLHELGRQAKEIIDDATCEIASNLEVLPDEIVYTSGATEANNLAIKGLAERYKMYGKHILVSSLEHNSIIASATTLQAEGFEVDLLPVDKCGFIDIDALKAMIRDDTILVSVCSVDSEIGLRQPIEEIGKFLQNYPHCFFHTDASQAIGKVHVDFSDVDLVTITPHKFYGLSGIGILIKKKGVGLKQQIDGGRSTTFFRSGTPELANIVSASKALDIALKKEHERYQYVKKLSDQIKSKLRTYKGVHINNTDSSIPHTINFSVGKIKALDFQKKLEYHNICVATKTSCCPPTTPSKLVYALTRDKNLASSSIRLSISHLTTEEEIAAFFKAFDLIYEEYDQNGKV